MSRERTAGDAPLTATTRAELMELHAAARRRRDSAALGSDEFRTAAEEVARIEIAVAQLEEPPPADPAGTS
jgi:hypothetical protein